MKLSLNHARQIISDPHQSLASYVEAAAAISASDEASESDLESCLQVKGLPAELVRMRMPCRRIAILEDDRRRSDEMTRELKRLPQPCRLKFFVDSLGMIEWLRQHQHEQDLISLDHDLNDCCDQDGTLRASGTGRDVVDFLALQPPTCPIIIHSSNDAAALAMTEELRTAGWPTSRVYPHDDIQWIAEDWTREIERLRCAGWLSGAAMSGESLETSKASLARI